MSLISHDLSPDAYAEAAAKIVETVYGIPPHLLAHALRPLYEAGHTLGMSPLECVRQIAKRMPWEPRP